MADFQMTLTAEERQFLSEFLKQLLHDTRIEEHRTRTLSYREFVVEREKVIEALLAKLGPPPE